MRGAVLVAAWLALGCARGAADAPQVTLRVLTWAQELQLNMDQAIADRFAARHPGVRVVVESVVANFAEKLMTSIASGAPPDVFLLDVPAIPAFVERGLVLDLSPYARRVGYDQGEVFPQVLEVFQRGDRLYAFPKDFTPMVLYCNRQVFARLGVAPPTGEWSWEQFLATARALTRDLDGDGQTDVYALDFPRNLYEWVGWVWSAGGDILDRGGRHAAGALDAPAAVATFGFLTELVTRWHVAPPVQFRRGEDPSRSNRFFSGKQAMLLSGHWSLPQLVKYAERGKLELGLAPIPHRAGAAPATVIYVSGWAVPASVRHKRLAVELAAFLSGEEAQRVRVATRIGISALRRIAEETAAADASGLERAFLREAAKGRMPWGARVVRFGQIEEMSLDVMDRALLRGEDVGVAARDVARAIDDVIAR